MTDLGCSISIGKKVADISNSFELCNSELKRQYLFDYIQAYNDIVQKVPDFSGFFGTGYPFYALNGDLTGQLPVIDEQIRYNEELRAAVDRSNHSVWQCSMCLSLNGPMMPNLKQLCVPCHNMDDALKPRKILNRLPDLDLWLVCDEGSISVAKGMLIQLFGASGISSSDRNPMQTIADVAKITESLNNGIMPRRKLPLDAHIIGYSNLFSLIEQVPYVLKQASTHGEIPYLPILPLSYRKDWQTDDAAYNFVFDYLASFTSFNFDDDLRQILDDTRGVVSKRYSSDQLYGFMLSTGPDSQKRRFETPVLRKRFEERIDSWKK